MANINFLNSNPNAIQQQHLNAISGKKNGLNSPNPKVLEEISQVNRRLKLVETSLRTMRSKVDSIERNQIENNKDNRRDIKTLEQENDELHSTLREIKQNMKIMAVEMQGAAKSEEVKVIQNYLDLWNPVKFVSPTQAKKLASDVFDTKQREHMKLIQKLQSTKAKK